MFGWLRNLFSSSPRAGGRSTRSLRARYDAAQTNHDNSRHWAAADGLSAATANSPAVRALLRKRSRYECTNNGMASGIVSTLTNDVIGTGPRLQIQAARELTRPIERAFRRWSDEVNLADKLRTMRRARCVDGEVFAVLVSNPRLMSRVQMDVRLVEADRVTDDTLIPASGWMDGIKYDQFGQPVAYRITNAHPGDTLGFIANPTGATVYESTHVVHDFRSDRPGQLRGVPELVSTLGLFAEMRRYTLAVLAAAETAADFAWFLKTTSPEIPASAADPFSTVEIERRMGAVLPAGYEPSQLKAEQPTTTYDMFRRNLINEAARPLNMPFNVAACDSSNYNYASGRMDHQVYQRAIGIDREQYARLVLDRILYAWLNEAALIPGLIPDGLGPFSEWDWAWRWDGFTHVDPSKEANAQATRLSQHTTTLAAEYANDQGGDWEEALIQRAREVDRMRELGLPIPTAQVVMQEAANDDT